LFFENCTVNIKELAVTSISRKNWSEEWSLLM
jgi:hypothetical protein